MAAFAWQCRIDANTSLPIPAGGSGWHVTTGTNTVPGQANNTSDMILNQSVAVFSSAEQAAAAMNAVSAAAAKCGKPSTEIRGQKPDPHDSKTIIPAGQDSWRVTPADEAGWSGWVNSMLETYDNRDDEINAYQALLRRGNVVLGLDINATTPTAFPGFGKQARSLASQVLSALNTVAPAGMPAAPSSSPSPSGGFPRISADQLCAAASPQQITKIAGFPVTKGNPFTYFGGDSVACIYDNYMVQIQITYDLSPKELAKRRADLSSKPLSGVGDVASQGDGSVEALVGDDEVAVDFPTLTPNPYAPKGSKAPPLTTDAADKASLAIIKMILAAQY